MISFDAVISLSGGMDSATLLGQLKADGRKVQGVLFEYGSKHNRYEAHAVYELCKHYGVPYRRVMLPMDGIKSNLLMSGGQIPEGHYEEDSMKKTVVPGRNMIFISHLAALAWSIGAKEVYIGIHAGDHAIYPDCRPNFYHAMRRAVMEGTDQQVDLLAPFLGINKASILRIGLGLKVPYLYTRTCYKDQPVACGKCGSCQERLEAFQLNGLADPIPYENRELMPKQPNPFAAEQQLPGM